jgi:two-component system sensor histidine kinase TctE
LPAPPTAPDAPVSLAEVARQVGLELALPAVQKGIDLALEADADDLTTVPGQALLLHEMVSNLVDNAIRYTPIGGSVLLQVGREGNQVALAVSDSGPGIAAADMDKVFMPFYRAQATLEANPGGTGLGLAIVRDIANLHGAAVTLGQSGNGPGLSVRVIFPAPAIVEASSALKAN